MNKPLFFNKLFFVFALLLISSISILAQTTVSANPQQEKLLNGLKVLSWRSPQTDKVTVKIRIHSGSAFDPQSKEGVMSLLAENLFPNQAARDFFAEDLGGSFELIKNHDFIQINTSGDSKEFLTILQTLSNAINNLTIDKETTAKLKAAQIEKLKETDKNPANIADQIAAKRLLGTFPYGRPSEGTVESVQKIDFADLIQAKDRFLTADNATIAVIGDVKSDFVFRAVKRFLGGWQKSESRVPSTFRQPDEPDTKPFSANINGNAETSEIRYALRGLARNDKDFAASEIVAKIVQNRLQNIVPKESSPFSRNEAHFLPGLMIFGYKNSNEKPFVLPENTALMLLSKEISNDEFTKAHAEVLGEFKAENQADMWFDVETFKLISVADETNNFNNVALADVQRVAQKLAKNPIVTVFAVQKIAETTKN